jgi:hypothetical protein
METSPKHSDAASMTEKAIAAMRAAVAKVIENHRRDNTPFAIWRDGKVVWLDPHTRQEVREDSSEYETEK